MNLEQKRDRLTQAIAYRSGPDSCNSVYLGGMHLARLTMFLGGNMWSKMDELIASASEKNIDRCLEDIKSHLEYMDRHPVKKCPCCGGIVSAK